MPEKIVELLAVIIDLKVFERCLNIANTAVKPRENPTIGKIEMLLRKGGKVDRIAAADLSLIQQKKTAGVPNLIREIASQLAFLGGKKNILSERGKVGNGKPQRIGPVFVDDVQRIGRIAERLAHFPALRVANNAGKVDLAERDQLFIPVSFFAVSSRHP